MLSQLPNVVNAYLVPFLWNIRLLLDADTIDVKISKGITDIIKIIRNIVNPIAILAVIGCGIYMLFGVDPQNIKKARGWLLAIVVGLAIVNVAEPIVNWAATLVGK